MPTAWKRHMSWQSIRFVPSLTQFTMLRQTRRQPGTGPLLLSTMCTTEQKRGAGQIPFLMQPTTETDISALTPLCWQVFFNTWQKGKLRGIGQIPFLTLFFMLLIWMTKRPFLPARWPITCTLASEMDSIPAARWLS